MVISKPTGMNHEEVMERAKALIPVFRAHSTEAEQLRRQSDETVKEIIDSCLVRMLIPKPMGGYELSFDTFLESVLEVSQVDASAGWCYAFFVVHAYFLALFSEQAQRDVWKENPDALLATSFIPAGRLRPVEGGYILNGSWQWSSGIDHCSWSMVNALIPPKIEGERPLSLFCLVPRCDIEVIDAWFVIGQRGTGSNNIAIKDAFVPEHRVVPFFDLVMGVSPGGQLYTNPMYKLPLNSAFPSTLVAPVLGATIGAYNTWRDIVRNKYTTYTREKVTEQSHIQIRVAEMAVQIDCAKLLLKQALADVRHGGPIDHEMVVRMQRDYAYITRLCVQVIEQLFQMSGGGANYESNPMQRYWRDIHAMAAHAILNFDTFGEAFGRMELEISS